jgi:hypothetical protein
LRARVRRPGTRRDHHGSDADDQPAARPPHAAGPGRPPVQEPSSLSESAIVVAATAPVSSAAPRAEAQRPTFTADAVAAWVVVTTVAADVVTVTVDAAFEPWAARVTVNPPFVTDATVPNTPNPPKPRPLGPPLGAPLGRPVGAPLGRPCPPPVPPIAQEPAVAGVTRTEVAATVLAGVADAEGDPDAASLTITQEPTVTSLSVPATWRVNVVFAE